MLGGQAGHVVSDEGDAVAYGVVSEGVGPSPAPAPALVDVPVRTCDEASGAQRILTTAAFHCAYMNQSDSFYLYPMSSQPLSTWWKRCMERMSAEHCSKVRQGSLGV